jgi:hypothetical protein
MDGEVDRGEADEHARGDVSHRTRRTTRGSQRSTPTTICVNECAGKAKWSVRPFADSVCVFGG